MEPIALLFDLDGTIVDTESACMQALTQVGAQLGVTLDEDHYASFVGRAWDAVFNELAAEAKLDRAGRMGLGRRVFEVYEGLLEAHLPTVPGAVELVRAAHAMPREQVRIALITGSTPRQAHSYLSRLGILELFEVVLGDGQYAQSKPHPSGYALAMSKLGVAPHQCMVFEDSAAGIASGRGAGAAVVAIGHANHFGQDQSHAHHRVQDLSTVDVDWCRARLKELR